MRSFAIVLLFMAFTASAQEKIFLYPDNKEKDAPFVESFPASKPNGMTIMVCPGGGYVHLAVDHEGKDIAKFYNENGFDAWVLHYRINDDGKHEYRFPDQYNDVTTAMKIVKSKSKNADKVGIIGFSAGGHLASMATTMHLPGTRPAFSILVYPVIAMNGEIAHQGSRENLIGKNPSEQLADSLSTYNRVDKNTPPTFIVYSADDDVVMVENGLRFYEALRKNNILATLHIYDHGGHGYGMAVKDPIINTWPKMSVEWVRSLKFK